MGISGPQYSLIVAVAHLQGDSGISVGAVAQALHVSSAFVASETGKLARRGFCSSAPIRTTAAAFCSASRRPGGCKIDRISAEIRAINDLFFGALDAKAFAALSAAAAALVESSAQGTRLHALATALTARRAMPRAAGRMRRAWRRAE